MNHPQPPFLKARWLLASFFGLFFGLGLGVIILGSLPLLSIQVGDPVLAPVLYSLVFIGLCGLILLNSPTLKVRALLGPWPHPLAGLPLLGLAIGVCCFSLGAAQVFDLLLAGVAPHLVEAARQQALLLSPDNTATPRLYHGLRLLSVVVVAPITEEFIFRGILLHRWAVKWGIRTAILLTSILFGVLHSNLLGLFVFGVVMSLLYLTTRSLLVPMAAHALHNALALGLDYVATRAFPIATVPAVAEFRSMGWFGVACLLVSAPWVLRYIVNHWPINTTALPYFLNQAQHNR